MMEQSLSGVGPWAEFQQRLNNGQFCLQYAIEGGHFFYPRVNVPRTGGNRWQWVEASGNASIYSLSRIPQKPERGGDYFVAIVELEEGPRMMTQLRLGGEITPKIGDKVQAVIEGANDEEFGDALLVFKHAGAR